MTLRLMAGILIVAVTCTASAAFVRAADPAPEQAEQVGEGAAPAVPSAALDPALPSMTMTEILSLSYRENPSLLAARAQYKAAQEDVTQARSHWRPEIGASAGVTDSHIMEGAATAADGTTSKEIAVEITQPLYRGGRTVAATDRAEKALAAQGALLEAASQDILLAAATSYMDMVRDRALLDLAKNNETVIAREGVATQDRFDVGEVTRTDVAQAQARLARAQSEKIRATGDMESSRAAFERVTGRLPGRLETPSFVFPFPETIDETIAMAQSGNPMVRAAEYVHASALGNIDEVFGELLPTLSLFGSVDKTFDPQPGLYDDTATRAVGISASIPLYEAGAVRSRVRQARHTANRRYLEILEARRDIREKAVSAWENLKTAESEIKSREAQVEASRIAQEGVKEETALGSRTVLDVLDAEQEHLDARAALVAAQRNRIVAEFELASTLGLLTPDILGFAPAAPPQQ